VSEKPQFVTKMQRGYRLGKALYGATQ
jgi:hypothetical protein